MTLCGTNCYLLGKGRSRVLVEAGDDTGANDVFKSNLSQFLDEQKIELSHIFITHAHHDHLGGLRDVLEMLNQPTLPKCYKMLTGNLDEK